MTSILVVRLDDLRIGLRISEIREVVWAVASTPLPHAPPVVEGVIDVRGQILPLLDLRLRFRLPPRSVSLSDRFVLAQASGRAVALRVDAAEAVLDLDDGAVSPVPRFAGAGAGLAGLAELPDGMVLIHDLSAFLSDVEAAALEDALPESAHPNR